LKKILFFTFITIICGGFGFRLGKPLKKVLIHFDDAYESVYKLAYPCMKKAGFVGTVFVPGSFIGKNEFMEWEELIEMEREGWEIGGHGYYHINLNSVSAEVCEKDVMMSFEVLKKHGLSPVSFAYPSEYGNPFINEIVFHYYQVIREKKYFSVRDDITMEKIIEYLQQMENIEKPAILVFHHISNDMSSNKPRKISCDYSLFEELIKYLHSQQYETLLMKDMGIVWENNNQGGCFHHL